MAGLCFTAVVVVYGIASGVSRDVDDFFPTASEAEATLAQILADEPELEGALWVEPVDSTFRPTDANRRLVDSSSSAPDAPSASRAAASRRACSG